MILLVLLLCLCCPVLAWDEDVHELIAELAWPDLKPAVRKKIEASLRTHPDPSVRTLARACSWPDLVKLKARPETALWHYINIPYNPDGTPAPPPKTPNVATELPRLELALSQGQNMAENLSFYGHLMGDLHQPMHAINGYSREFPGGDLGGFKIALPGGANLHHYWDGVAELPVPEDRQQLVAQLRAAFPREFYPELSERRLEHWLEESHRLAVSVAYAWPGVAEPTRAVGLRRVVLAAYRLADRLNELLSQPDI